MTATAEHFVKGPTNISRTSNCNKLLSTYLFCICGPFFFHLNTARRTTKLIWTTEHHGQTGNAELDACAYVLPRCWQRYAAVIYRVLLWYWISMLRSIDTCQNEVSADQYHLTISRAQVHSPSWSCVFLKLAANQVLVFDWIAGSSQVNLLKTGQDCSEAG